VTLGYAGAFFYVLAAMALVSAIMVIVQKNAVHSAMFLVFTFFCVAGIYVALSAEFVAAVQVLVYAGGIVVLFLFVIMLVPLSTGLRAFPIKQGVAALLLAAMLAGGAAVFFQRVQGADASRPTPDISSLGRIEGIGDLLYTRYLLPFEVASVLLLVAMIGAVVLARRQV
jgi:NADH-quinone oxidoreductase subunit J